MGFSKKQQLPSLKPISTRPRDSPATDDCLSYGDRGGREEKEESTTAPTTPTSNESRIPERLPCPPAPKKRRPASTGAGLCHLAGAREFFIPPDLESVFKYHFERAI